MKNRTSQDAFERVTIARVGSLVNSTQEYRDAMIKFLSSWVDDLQQENYRRNQNNAVQKTPVLANAKY